MTDTEYSNWFITQTLSMLSTCK